MIYEPASMAIIIFLLFVVGTRRAKFLPRASCDIIRRLLCRTWPDPLVC